MAKPKLKKRSNEELQQEITERTEAIMKYVEEYTRDPEEVIKLLNFMTNFHHYSARNQILIQSQFQGAMAVASLESFNKKGFFVNNGEKAIKILVPVQVKLFERDPDNWVQISHATETEKKQIEAGVLDIREITRFKLGSVFDVSQTNAKEEDIPDLLPNKHMNYETSSDMKTLQSALIHIANDRKVYVSNAKDVGVELGNVRGEYRENLIDGRKDILLNQRNTVTENFSILVHELAHESMHSQDSLQNKEVSLTVANKEFQAEMTAYVVCKHFGVDTEEKATAYIASWTEKGESVEDRLHLLDEVHKTSKHFIQEIEGYLEKSFEPLYMQAKSLPEGWKWRKDNEVSGCLESPSRDEYFNYRLDYLEFRHPDEKGFWDGIESFSGLEGETFTKDDFTRFAEMAEYWVETNVLNQELESLAIMER